MKEGVKKVRINTSDVGEVVGVGLRWWRETSPRISRRSASTDGWLTEESLILRCGGLLLGVVLLRVGACLAPVRARGRRALIPGVGRSNGLHVNAEMREG
jgi:hypothetical protein